MCPYQYNVLKITVSFEKEIFTLIVSESNMSCLNFCSNLTFIILDRSHKKTINEMIIRWYIY